MAQIPKTEQAGEDARQSSPNLSPLADEEKREPDLETDHEARRQAEVARSCEVTVTDSGADQSARAPRADGLIRGAIPENAVHLCIDMQRMFAEDTPWRTPWMDRVTPVVVGLCQHKPERICFTRFIPAAQVGEGKGTWQGYWKRWPEITIDRMGADMIDLIPALAPFVPPARVLDKRIYSPWPGTGLDEALRVGGVDTLLITGTETDVCVLAAVLGAVDLGYRVVVVTDGLCSSSDETHDALLGLYRDRYGQQVETARSDEVLAGWR